MVSGIYIPLLTGNVSCLVKDIIKVRSCNGVSILKQVIYNKFLKAQVEYNHDEAMEYFCG